MYLVNSKSTIYPTVILLIARPFHVGVAVPHLVQIVDVIVLDSCLHVSLMLFLFLEDLYAK